MLLRRARHLPGPDDDLRAEAESLALEREPGDVQFDEESGEGGTVAVDRERDLTLAAQAQATIAQIDVALGAIEDKTYGRVRQLPSGRYPRPAFGLCLTSVCAWRARAGTSPPLSEPATRLMAQTPARRSRCRCLLCRRGRPADQIVGGLAAVARRDPRHLEARFRAHSTTPEAPSARSGLGTGDRRGRRRDRRDPARHGSSRGAFERGGRCTRPRDRAVPRAICRTGCSGPITVRWSIS